jgi:hypothetical protein
MPWGSTGPETVSDTTTLGYPLGINPRPTAKIARIYAAANTGGKCGVCALTGRGSGMIVITNPRLPRWSSAI